MPGKTRKALARVLCLTTVFLGVLAVPLLASPQPAQAAVTVTDTFNRANGSLGPNWTDMSDGGLAISSQVVVGTSSGYSGDIRTGETYSSDQSSQIALTSTQLTGGQWIGPAVRAQNGGQSLYLGLYWWNNGNPELMLFKRTSGAWTQLGSTDASGPLAAGTQLTLSASGSSLTFAENGAVVISATDTTLSGGAPGIMTYGTPQGGTWVGVGSTGAASTYSVGGSLSGLSGTVVLEDNGADDLSLSANGSFTFATPLAQNATYAVSVKTNPTGQSCTVVNGSGTVGTANVTTVAVTCGAQTGTVTDTFNRANGSLGPNWTDMSDGGLAISSQVVVGTSSGYSGDIRTGETYSSDQSSQIALTSTQLTGGQWIGPAVRAQNGGQSLYLGLYWWNNGNPELMLFKRTSGAWTQLGSTDASGPLAAGTQLTLSASGSSLTFAENGAVVISATDTTLSGGAPGIMTYGTPQGGTWVGVGSTGAASTYSVGGSLSGLSGTVVLEDNGADDLSLSANGSFTFATPLAQNATYAVSVKTNPTGQSCTVVNGSGTVGTANVTTVAVTCGAQTGTVTDTFNRANGSLGPNWTDMSDGGLAISSQVVVGTSSGYSGDIRTGETYSSDQSSQIALTSTQLTGGQWIGPAVRAQNGGQSLYLGLYWWNNGNPELMLFKRTSGAWTQLGSTDASGPLAAGTQLTLSASGSSLTFAENGAVVISATDTTLSGGAPGIMTYGTPQGGTWVGVGSTGAASTYSVGGSLSGLSGTVVLEDNGADDLSLSANGSFTFATPLAQNATYAVSVKTNPTGQSCTVVNGSGTVGTANVTTVAVTCGAQAASTYSVGGSLSGLSGTVVLEDNGADDLSLSANGSFTFATPLAQNATYAVSVKTNPTGQSCTVVNGSGTVGTANVTTVAVTCGAQTGTVTDTFNRANGSLGPNWTDMSDGGLAISSQVVVGTSSGYSGDIRTGETYSSDQSSQIALTSTQLTGGQWIGPAVRAQNGGQSLYLGLYWWNNGNPELMLFKRTSGAWTQLGSTDASGPLAAGTQLTLSASGSSLTFAENGAVVISATDTTLSGGAPGIMTYGTPQGGTWVGVGSTGAASTYSVGGSLSGLSGTVVLEDNGADDLSLSANGSFTFATPLAQNATYAVSVKTNPTGQSCTVVNGSGTVGTANVTTVAVTCGAQTGTGLTAQYVSTDASGVEYYSVTSAANGPSSQTLRVLLPSHPEVGMAHNFIYVLPVEPGLATDYGDGLDTLQALDAEDQYNLTIIEPTFGADPWYADDPDNASEQYETFMTELQPWVQQTFGTSGHEQNWLIGFSKSGLGAQDLILKHPDLFQLAASWDFPADMSSYAQFGQSSINAYGSDANFQANYRLTQAFVDAHRGPFTSANRIWIGGYDVFQTDISDYDALLTSEGVLHTTGPSQLMAHTWGSGWVPEALAALSQDSTQLP